VWVEAGRCNKAPPGWATSSLWAVVPVKPPEVGAWVVTATPRTQARPKLLAHPGHGLVVQGVGLGQALEHRKVRRGVDRAVFVAEALVAVPGVVGDLMMRGDAGVAWVAWC
jgi:hypothetical protein